MWGIKARLFLVLVFSLAALMGIDYAQGTVSCTVPLTQLYVGQNIGCAGFSVVLQNVGYANSQGLYPASLAVYQNSNLIGVYNVYPASWQAVGGNNGQYANIYVDSTYGGGVLASTIGWAKVSLTVSSAPISSTSTTSTITTITPTSSTTSTTLTITIQPPSCTVNGISGLGAAITGLSGVTCSVTSPSSCTINGLSNVGAVVTGISGLTCTVNGPSTYSCTITGISGLGTAVSGLNNLVCSVTSSSACTITGLSSVTASVTGISNLMCSVNSQATTTSTTSSLTTTVGPILVIARNPITYGMNVTILATTAPSDTVQIWINNLIWATGTGAATYSGTSWMPAGSYTVYANDITTGLISPSQTFVITKATPSLGLQTCTSLAPQPCVTTGIIYTKAGGGPLVANLLLNGVSVNSTVLALTQPLTATKTGCGYPACASNTVTSVGVYTYNFTTPGNNNYTSAFKVGNSVVGNVYYGCNTCAASQPAYVCPPNCSGIQSCGSGYVQCVATTSTTSTTTSTSASSSTSSTLSTTSTATSTTSTTTVSTTTTIWRRVFPWWRYIDVGDAYCYVGIFGWCLV